MTRAEIMDNCPEEFEEELKDFVDRVESKFQEIRDLLNIDDISQLSQIESAYNLAYKYADDLY